MNINVFTTGNTNIYPMANSLSGGQLATEFNTRSRETVSTDPNVSYLIGHSFTHSLADFAVSKAEAGGTSAQSNTVLVISPGRALVNGHYVECVTDVQIDIAILNQIIVGNQNISEKYQPTIGTSERKLSGRCCIGLRALYSGQVEKYGSLISENWHNDKFDYDDQDAYHDRYYNGIQVVVLNESDFKVPSDGVAENEITAHLKLATFEVRNSVIVGDIEDNLDRIKYLDVSRLVNAEKLVGEEYPSTANLNLNKHYVMSPIGNGKMGWCDATSNLKDWERASFYAAGYDPVLGRWPIKLQIPPMLVDGASKQPDTINLTIPVADYVNGTPGTVDIKYTNKIKEIGEKVDQIYSLPNGKCKQYISELSDRSKLPLVNPNWGIGDYVIVGRDLTVDNSSDNISAPSTMYMVTPGKISSVSPLYKFSQTDHDSSKTESNRSIIRVYFVNNVNWSNVYLYGFYGEEGKEPEAVWPTYYPGLPMNIAGITDDKYAVYYMDIPSDIDYIKFSDGSGTSDTVPRTNNIHNSMLYEGAGFSLYNKSSNNTYSVNCHTVNISGVATHAEVSAQNWDCVSSITLPTSHLGTDYDIDTLSDQIVESLYGSDASETAEAYNSYVQLRSSDETDSAGATKYIGCYIVTATDSTRQYSDPLYITGEIGFASTDRVGGFLNFDESATGATDNGYVKLNDEGYLQLVDYPLLRSGLLAYQLGESVKISSGIDVESIQAELDNFVNRRVAFANASHLAAAEAKGISGSLQHVIDVYLPLSDVSAVDGGTIKIYEIDSRFNTPVCIHVSGNDLSNYTLEISDCQKIRIVFEDVKHLPTVNLYRSCLYYDASVLSCLNSISGLSLWYHRYNTSNLDQQVVADYASSWADEPELVVDGMTVKRSDSPYTLAEITGSSSNTDIHYDLGIYSLTFNEYGNIIGISIAIDCACTKLWDDGKFTLVGSIPVPEDIQMFLPLNRLVADLNVCGRVTHSYKAASTNYVVTITDASIQVNSTTGNLDFTFSVSQDTINLSNVIYAWSEGKQTIQKSSIGNSLPGMTEGTQILSGGVMIP